MGHPPPARQSSTYSNVNNGTPKINSNGDRQGNSLRTNSNNGINLGKFVAINRIENDVNDTEIGSRDESKHGHLDRNNILNIQNDSTSLENETLNIEIKFYC